MDRDREGEVGARRDGVLVRLGQHLAARVRLRGDDVRAVQARRRAAGRRAAEPLQHEGHRVLGDEVLVGDEVRVGRHDAADALVLHHGRRRDPGRSRPRRRRSRAAARPARRAIAASPVAFDVAVVAKVVASPSTPLTRSCSASMIAWFSSRSGPGGFRLCAAATFCCSCSAIPASFVGQAADLRARRRQRVRDRGAVVLELCAIVADLRHVVLVAVVLGRRRARLDQEPEEHEHHDDERRPAPAGAGAASARGAAPPGGACPCRGRRGAAAGPGSAARPARSSPARLRRSRTRCRRRAGPCAGRIYRVRSLRKGNVLAAP